MKPSLTDTLCTQCGLCCDGSLFADVELVSGAEATRLEIMGLKIDDDSDRPLLLLPCAALEGTRCNIYVHRPKCCRSFECHLLQEAQRGAVTVKWATEQIAEAHQRIKRVKDLLSQLGQTEVRLPLKERCAEALSEEPSAIPGVKRKRAELATAMSAVERLIRKTFLGVGGARSPRSPKDP